MQFLWFMKDRTSQHIQQNILNLFCQIVSAFFAIIKIYNYLNKNFAKFTFSLQIIITKNISYRFHMNLYHINVIIHLHNVYLQNITNSIILWLKIKIFPLILSNKILYHLSEKNWKKYFIYTNNKCYPKLFSLLYLYRFYWSQLFI